MSQNMIKPLFGDLSDEQLTLWNSVTWSKGWYTVAKPESVPLDYYYKQERDTYLKCYGTEQILTKELISQYFTNVRGNVWLRLASLPGDIESFISISSGITQAFTLITTDGDRSVPSDIQGAQSLLDNPHLQMWYTQNYDGTAHEKLKPIPIGLDLHVYSLHLGKTPYDRLRRMHGMKSMGPADKQLSVYVDGGNTDYGRSSIIYSLRSCPHVYKEPGRLPPEETWKKYMSYHFVLSMPGNGMDCHRTWEILFFGCIPIVKRSPLDPLYHNLPVIIVDDWNDICTANLKTWLQYASAFKPVRSIGYTDWIA